MAFNDVAGNRPRRVRAGARAFAALGVAAVCGLAAGPGTAAAATPVHEVTMVLTTPAGSSLTQTTTVQDARDEFAKMSDYWLRHSNGQVDFRLARVEWWPGHGTCGGSSGAAGDASQQQSGFVPGPQKHLATIVAGCGPAGNSSITSGLTAGGRVYIEGFWDGFWTHEFAHNLGLGHANLLLCPGSEVDGDLVADGGDCARKTYHDPLDTMGSSYQSYYKGFSTPNAIKAGFMPAADYASFDGTENVDQTVTVTSRDLAAGKRSVQVTEPKSGRTYWVEMSTNDGDNQGFLSASGTTQTYDQTTYRRHFGVRVLRADGNGTLLLSAPVVNGERAMNWAPGTTFQSAGGGVRVDVISATDTTATLRVRTEGAVDTTAPAAPVGMTATAEADAVTLSWEANGEQDLAGYVLYRDGVKLATLGTATGYTDADVTPGTTYSYTLRAVDVAGNASAAGAAASASVPPPSPVATGGVYEILNVATGRVVDNPGSSRTSGTQLIQWGDHDGLNQRWTFTAAAGGGFTAQNSASGLCMGLGSGSAVVQATCSAAAAQRWVPVGTQSAGYRFELTGTGMCLAVPGGTTARGTGLVAEKCSDAPAQRWTFTRVS